jgi:hypothetical protein
MFWRSLPSRSSTCGGGREEKRREKRRRGEEERTGLINKQYRPEEDVLNGAQSGATVQNLITHELDYLLKVMKANPNISMQEEWKLLTLFIGGNDLCESCRGYLNDPGTFSSPLISPSKSNAIR